MNRFTFLIAVFFPLIFSNCDKTPTSEPEFDSSLIPGIYDGSIEFAGFDIVHGDTIPGSIYIDSECEISITNIGELKFMLSVDEPQILPVPSIELAFRKLQQPYSREIIYLENDSNYSKYRLHGGGTTFEGYYFPPSNHISSHFYEPDRISFHLTIKKSKPDSIYFLAFWGNK